MALSQTLSLRPSMILRLTLNRCALNLSAMLSSRCLEESRIWSLTAQERLQLAAPLLMPEWSEERSSLTPMAQESLLAVVLTAAKTRPRLIAVQLTWLGTLPNPLWQTGLQMPGSVWFP